MGSANIDVHAHMYVDMRVSLYIYIYTYIHVHIERGSIFMHSSEGGCSYIALRRVEHYPWFYALSFNLPFTKIALFADLHSIGETFKAREFQSSVKSGNSPHISGGTALAPALAPAMKCKRITQLISRKSFGKGQRN